MVQYSTLISHPALNMSMALDFPEADTFPETFKTGVSSPAALSLCLAQLPVEQWCLVFENGQSLRELFSEEELDKFVSSLGKIMQNKHDVYIFLAS